MNKLQIFSIKKGYQLKKLYQTQFPLHSNTMYTTSDILHNDERAN